MVVEKGEWKNALKKWTDVTVFMELSPEPQQVIEEERD